MAKPAIIYGGPYAHESDAITAESAKKHPNYDQLISGWKSISQGASDYIHSLKNPVNPEPGEFMPNVVVDYEKVDEIIPAVEDFDNAKTPEPKQTEVDLENL